MSRDALTKALGGALNSGAVKRKSNNTKSLRSKARRMAKGSPEVMVKVTGFGKGAAHIKAHLKYISRKGELELENERGEIVKAATRKNELGEVVKDTKAVEDLLERLSTNMGQGRSSTNSRDTVHVVLSMPPETPEEGMRNAVRSFAKNTFGKNHEYVFAVHTPANDPNPEPSAQPHAHLVVRLRGFDGTKLDPRKADLQEWREAFAAELRFQGIDAEATPAASRGSPAKRDSNVIRHIERGSESRPPRVPREVAHQVREAAQRLAAGHESTQEARWQQAAAQRLAKQRDALAQAAHELRKGAQEKNDARPDYRSIDPAAVRRAQRSAAVHQSRGSRSRPQGPANASARVRNVPPGAVVQSRRRPEVLLQGHALPGVGSLAKPGDGMRRSGTGVDALAERGRRIVGLAHGLAADGALAARLEAMAAALPAQVKSRSQALQDALRAKFKKDGHLQKDQGREPLPARAPDAGPER